jgi:hypothetical protein
VSGKGVDRKGRIGPGAGDRRSGKPDSERARPDRLRPDPGLLLAALAGFLLFLLLFRGWFGLETAAPVTEGAVGVGLGRSFDAWVSFAWIDLFLLAVSVVAVGSAVAGFAGLRLRIRPGLVLVAIGAGAFVLVAYRLILPPWDGAEREMAPFLALLCCLGISGGGFLSFAIATGRIGLRSRAG